jgi:cobalt/nickel transport system permease protein
MALPGVLVHYGYRAFANSSRPAMRNAAAFGAGFFALFFSSAGLAMTLAATGEPFYLLAKVSFGAHFPMMFVEGAISYFVIGFLRKVKPEMLDTSPIFAKRK